MPKFIEINSFIHYAWLVAKVESYDKKDNANEFDNANRQWQG